MKALQTNIKLFLYTPNRFFVIPTFQRPYSWTRDNIDSFLQDLEDVRAGDKKHFFGSLVCVPDGDSNIIIDGQQRATTVLLMLTAIYHIATQSPEKCAYVADQIKDEYLFNKYAKQYGSEENRIKLRAVTTDNEIFEAIFAGGDVDQRIKESRLYAAYTRFRDYFSEREQLETYIDALESFEVVTIVLDSDDDNPQRVFESINSTGKPLTDGDKIRNFALMLGTQEKQQYVLEKYWKHIEESLTDTNKDYITDFFRMYIISVKQAPVKLDAVYPEFKKLFYETVDDDQSIQTLDAFYGDVVVALRHYLMLRFEKDATGGYTSIANTAFVLRYLRIDLYTPFGMAVMRRFDTGQLNQHDLRKVFEIIQVYFSRRIICGLLATSLDRLFATLDRDVMAFVEGEGATYLDAMAYILTTKSGQTRLPDDTEMKRAIEMNATYSQRAFFVNYILTAVDDTSKESSLLRQINSGEVRLSIEHIMPQTLTDTWRTELGKDATRVHATYLHGLANLTLTGYNSEYSNRSFLDKKTRKNGFMESPLKINQTVSCYDKWNEEALLERQAWWIDKLLDIWPMPTTGYTPVHSSARISLLEKNDLLGTKIRVLFLKGDTLPVSSWAEALDMVVERMFELDATIVEKIESDEFCSRYIRSDKHALISPEQIGDTDYYVETGTNTNYKQKLIAILGKKLGWSHGDVAVELAEPLERR